MKRCRSITRQFSLFILTFLWVLTLSQVSSAWQRSLDTLNPYYEQQSYSSIGSWSVSNHGEIRGGFLDVVSLWIGGQIGRDTIVALASDGWSTGGIFSSEFQPGSELSHFLEDEFLKVRSVYDQNTTEGNLAKSEFDVIVHYSDTPTNTGVNYGRSALYAKVKQTSYAWTADYARNILLVNYEITNIGPHDIKNAYIGLFFDGDDGPFSEMNDRPGQGMHALRKITSFFHPDDSSCGYQVNANALWYCSPDGDPDLEHQVFDMYSRTGVSGAMILGPRDPSFEFSFNWWLTSANPREDFGPRKTSIVNRNYLSWGNRSGTPFTEGERYTVMSNGEIDYDQFAVVLDHSSQGWLFPPPDAMDIVDGRYDTHCLLSVGAFDIFRGATTQFSIALFGDFNFHKQPIGFFEKFDPLNPEKYYEEELRMYKIDDKVINAMRIYDNFGYDSNGDGYRGEYKLCPAGDSVLVDSTVVSIDSMQSPPDTIWSIDSIIVATNPDTLWISGDGIPDFRGLTPPADPNPSIDSRDATLYFQWNGKESETQPDFFTGDVDFEGYRVYIGLTNRIEDLQLVSTYDIKNYDRRVLLPDTIGPAIRTVWKILEPPRSLADLKSVYGGDNPDWDPLVYTRLNPLYVEDSAIMFEPHDWNESNVTDTFQIHKVYPEAPYPHTLSADSAFTSDTNWVNPMTGDTTFYDDGELIPGTDKFKYFEYRYVIRNLLPSIPYYVTVTAFDHGAPQLGVNSLETNKLASLVTAIPQNRRGEDDELDVIVYPNPYRIDGNYRGRGFEGRGSDLPDEQTRLVHFTNLPPQCDIKIYTLDGDMVRQIIHDKPPGAADAMHETWDVLSRNLQVPVSGIYYWVVETPNGRTQLGKLVLIM